MDPRLEKVLLHYIYTSELKAFMWDPPNFTIVRKPCTAFFNYFCMLPRLSYELQKFMNCDK